MTLFFSCLCVLVLESMGDAVLGLPCQELLLKASAHRWSHSGLHQYVLAIATFLNHPFNAIHLTLDTPNPIQIRCMARVLPHRCTPRSMVIYLGQHRHRLVDYLNDGRYTYRTKNSAQSRWSQFGRCFAFNVLYCADGAFCC